MGLTENELAMLLEKYPTTRSEVLQAMFPGFSKKYLQSVANKHGLKKQIGFGGRVKFTAAEMEYLKANYANVSNIELAKHFGIEVHFITGFATKHGLKKSKSFMQSLVSDRFVDGGKKTRFKTGQQTWNKGLDIKSYLSPESLEKMAKSHFKKGHVPHNHLPLFSERISKGGYVEIKVTEGVSKNNYMFKHRWLWEQQHGPVPKGKTVVFKNGNPMDFSLDNLELIDRKELLSRNRLVDSAILKHNLGIKDPVLQEQVKTEYPELIKAKRSELLIKQEIRKYETSRAKGA